MPDRDALLLLLAAGLALSLTPGPDTCHVAARGVRLALAG